jgi:hypothetical protein
VAELFKPRGLKEERSDDGPVAHLVERLFCIQEVRSSSLLGSTKEKKKGRDRVMAARPFLTQVMGYFPVKHP